MAYLGGLAALALHFWLSRSDTTLNYPVRYLQLSLAAHLAVAFAAFVGRDEENGFWQFNRQLFHRFLESGLYAAVFFGGVSLAAWTLASLFDVRIPFTFYARLWIFSVFVLLTWRFLALVPHPLGALRHDERYPRDLRIFIQYLLVPLVVLYGAILYAYLAKIVVLWNWPKGEVGWLVSAASVFGVFTLLMLYPAAGPGGPLWARAYTRLFWPAIVPLLGMLFIALGKRVGQYGVTERRYFLGALAAWLLAMAAYFITSRRPRIIGIPVSLALAALITLIGPWGAYGVSMRSQQGRLEALLAKNGLWRDGRIEKTPREVGWEDQREISAALVYLVHFHGPAAVSRWFADAGFPSVGAHSGAEPRPDAGAVAESMMAAMGLRYVGPYESSQRLRFANHDRRASLDIAGYDHMIEVRFTDDPALSYFTLDGREYVAHLDGRAAVFEVRRGQEVVLRQGVRPLLDGRLEPTSGWALLFLRRR